MYKNKIYNYLIIEILKNFFTILLIFTLIAWTVRAVNFLDLMIEDGFPLKTYIKYSLLNILAISSKFISLSFLLSMLISLIKFELQKEFQILWITGINKINVANIFILISFFITFLYLLLSTLINPLLLNKSRALLKENENKQINTILKSNNFNDAFQSVTIFVEKKNEKGELINIFIKDSNNTFNNFFNEIDQSKNLIIVASKGIIKNQKLILFNGIIQSMNEKKQIKNINFDQTELSTSNFNSRTIMQAKIQETLTYDLINCFIKKNKKLLLNCPFNANPQLTIETISKRLAAPLYIPMISILMSLLLINKKEKKFFFLKKYFLFIIVLTILILAEILGKYSGFSIINAIVYFFFPLILSLLLYLLLINNLYYEKFKA